MYKEFIRPVIDHLDSETMHIAAREGLHFTENTPGGLKILEFLFAFQRHRFTDPRLAVTIDGVNFDNPLIVGAGWDKPGRAVEALYRLGFAGAEIGTLTAWDQDGNPKPRQWAKRGIADNFLGFNNPGMNTGEKNLRHYLGKGIPIGVSVGKNKEVSPSDSPFVHAIVAERLYKYATWFSINVSSPNTPGLRALQDKSPLSDICDGLIESMDRGGGRKSWYIKISPDLTLTAVDDVIEVAIEKGASGIVAANTTINPEIKASHGWADLAGGFSGDDPQFTAMSNRIIAHIHRETNGQLPTIGVGGVHDGPSALQKIMAGASALQVVTGIRGEGTHLPGRTNYEIIEYMNRNGIKNLNDLVGIEAAKY
jgi:dihydroorotate dehydrogenase